MRGVIITDATEDNFLAVNLLDILRLIEPLVLNSQWKISGLECFGSAADSLHEIADNKVKVTGKQLLDLAANITQVIDGVFVGYYQNTYNPWVIIRAVDSFAYQVQSEDFDLLVRISKHFKNVVELPLLQEEKV